MELDHLYKKLDERVKNGSIRCLKIKEGLVDFVSNDYLGLSKNVELYHQVMERCNKEKIANGATGSRLLSGNYQLIEQAELFFAELFKAESALVFNSGYAANQALVSSVAAQGDTILYDQLAHVCLKEGAWLSKGSTVAFKHNDLEDLESKLKRATGHVYVLTESIFSMDGDMAPIREQIELCEQYGAFLIVDEAHSTGIYGEGGSGWLVANDLHEKVFARVYTFGKAMGVHGACVAGDRVLIDYLINFGRPFIYTTSLPPHSVIAMQESFRYLADHTELQAELQTKIALFQKKYPQALSSTAIQPIPMGSNEKARAASQYLESNGFDIRPILSPTVRKTTERLRVSLHVHNSDEAINELADHLVHVS